MNTADIATDILRRVEILKDDEAEIGVWSTGEQIAVALVMNRLDLLPRGYTHVLDAVERLGDDWLKAAFIARRAL